jgi:type I restriction enzyme S subunit
LTYSDLNSIYDRITVLRVLSANQRGIPEPGDVLFTTEAPLGKAAVVNISEQFALAQRVIDLHPFSGLDGKFLMWLILSPWFQGELLERATGMTAQGIKAAKLKLVKIPLPPLAEQKRIVAKVDELMALCDTLEAAQQTRNTLRQSLRASALDALMNATSDDELATAWAFVRDN